MNAGLGEHGRQFNKRQTDDGSRIVGLAFGD